MSHYGTARLRHVSRPVRVGGVSRQIHRTAKRAREFGNRPLAVPGASSTICARRAGAALHSRRATPGGQARPILISSVKPTALRMKGSLSGLRQEAREFVHSLLLHLTALPHGHESSLTDHSLVSPGLQHDPARWAGAALTLERLQEAARQTAISRQRSAVLALRGGVLRLRGGVLRAGTTAAGTGFVPVAALCPSAPDDVCPCSGASKRSRRDVRLSSNCGPSGAGDLPTSAVRCFAARAP